MDGPSTKSGSGSGVGSFFKGCDFYLFIYFLFVGLFVCFSFFVCLFVCLFVFGFGYWPYNRSCVWKWYYHWPISIIMTSYRQTSYSGPSFISWSINPYWIIHISTPALTTPLLSHWPIRIGHFWRLNAPWPMRGQDLPHLRTLLCKSAPHCSTQKAPKGYLIYYLNVT